VTAVIQLFCSTSVAYVMLCLSQPKLCMAPVELSHNFTHTLHWSTSANRTAANCLL